MPSIIGKVAHGLLFPLRKAFSLGSQVEALHLIGKGLANRIPVSKHTPNRSIAMHRNKSSKYQLRYAGCGRDTVFLRGIMQNSSPIIGMDHVDHA